MLTICAVLVFRSQKAYLLRLVFYLFTSPPSVLLLFSGLYLYFFLPTSPPPSSLLGQGAGFVLRGMASALNAWLFHSCWLFPVVCLGVWPLWLMSWVLSTLREPVAVKPHSD